MRFPRTGGLALSCRAGRGGRLLARIKRKADGARLTADTALLLARIIWSPGASAAGGAFRATYP